MKLTGISKEDYASTPHIIVVNSNIPKLANVELPLTVVSPKVLRSAKGRVCAYLIDYKPQLNTDDNVAMTRHCLYVDKSEYERVVRMQKDLGIDPTHGYNRPMC